MTLTTTDRSKSYRGISIPELEADFEAYVEKKTGQSRGENLPEGYVPSTELWLVDGDEYIGSISIRHRPTEYLEKLGGHIGYDIRPSMRGRGYGSKILELALPKAKELGTARILVTCDATNAASRKIIEKNGGVFSKTKSRTRKLASISFGFGLRMYKKE